MKWLAERFKGSTWRNLDGHDLIRLVAARTSFFTGRTRLLALLGLLLGNPAGLLGQASAGPGNQSKPPLPEYIQEFFLSDAVRNQDRGELQMTLGVDSRQGAATNITLRSEYGVTRRLEINFELPYGSIGEERSEPVAQWSTTTLGVQYQLIRSNAPFALSAGMAFEIPINSTGEFEYEPSIIAAKHSVGCRFMPALSPRSKPRRKPSSHITSRRYTRFAVAGFRRSSSMADNCTTGMPSM